MAIYEGARPRATGFELPWLRPVRAPRLSGEPRPAVRPATRRTARTTKAAARPGIRGQRRVGVALAGIVIAFSVGFVSLTQSVRVAATSYDITRLVSEHDRLSALEQDLTSNLERLRGEPAIRKEALDAGLGQLGSAVVLPAR
jgi:hypothetical protein